ncbi:hypothetical protein FD725_15940 [Nostoc sp. TCL26-01]|nr:hypothetical protein FD725_15940 [Nostoc sp. TCL26-01]
MKDRSIQNGRRQEDKGSQHRAGVSPVEVTGVTRGQGENTCIGSFPPSPSLPIPPSSHLPHFPPSSDKPQILKSQC